VREREREGDRLHTRAYLRRCAPSASGTSYMAMWSKRVVANVTGVCPHGAMCGVSRSHLSIWHGWFVIAARDCLIIDSRVLLVALVYRTVKY
jgi:hypothetical protein